MRKLYVLRIPKLLEVYIERWESIGFKHIDVKYFLEWVFAVAVDDFETGSDGAGFYGTIYDDYFRLITAFKEYDIDSEWFRKTQKNCWNLILTASRTFRRELDLDEFNRRTNPNLDLISVVEYQPSTGIIVVEIMEEP